MPCAEALRTTSIARITWKPDIVIGHNPGALGPLVAIGNKLTIPTLFDAEDFHRGEFALDSKESLSVQKLEDECIPQVAAMTAASPLIAKTYGRLYPQHEVTTINNAFAKKQPATDSNIRIGTAENHLVLPSCWFGSRVRRIFKRDATRTERAHSTQCIGVVLGNCKAISP